MILKKKGQEKWKKYAVAVLGFSFFAGIFQVLADDGTTSSSQNSATKPDIVKEKIMSKKFTDATQVAGTNGDTSSASAPLSGAEMKNATKMKLLISTQSGTRVTSEITTTTGTTGKGTVGEMYSPATAKIKAENTKLFTPKKNKETTSAGAISPLAVGTSGAYYSSSRLNPRISRVRAPFRTAGKLYFRTTSGRTSWCSASVISRRIVVTAGHCVHRGNNNVNGWYTNFTFVPGYDNGVAPLGTWTATRAITTLGWYRSGGIVPATDDHAILIMRDRTISNRVYRIGEITGQLGWLTNALHPNHITQLGYPANLDNGLIMQVNNAETWRQFPKNNFSIGSDMRGGSSGGPWVQNFGIQSVGKPVIGAKGLMNRVVAVTSFGFVPTGPKEAGASTLRAAFVSMWNFACARNIRNCR